MKKKAAFLLALLLGLAALPVFGGCAPTASTVSAEWQLDYYTFNGEKYSVEPNEMDYFRPVARDVVKLELKKDETFTFTDYRGTMYEGTYDVRRVRIRTWYTEVNLHTENEYYFSSGTYLSRSGARTLTFYRNGVDYHFVKDLKRTWDNAIEEGLAREVERLRNFEAGGRKDYDGLFHGEVEREDGVWFLTVYNDYGEISRYNLGSEEKFNYTVYTYRYDANYAITEGTLQEGECAVKWKGIYSIEAFAIHSFAA